jgi:hypothetical protein
VRAFSELVYVVDTEKTETEVGTGKIFVPMRLVCGEHDPFIIYAGMLRNNYIGRKLEYTIWAVLLQGFVVETHVPNSGGCVLRHARFCCVDEKLLGGGVGPQESG